MSRRGIQWKRSDVLTLFQFVEVKLVLRKNRQRILPFRSDEGHGVCDFEISEMLHVSIQ